ncbi:MAG: DUF4843 domain-containing protein [Odoribacteraceae bacterium]|jgi:hypothetical protein|nr:DUF4843 domain-containing protein [Odoribacteraceae bacterium]
MNNRLIQLALCCALLSCASCTEEVVPDYTGDHALYFYRGTYETIHVYQRDSLFYSFLSGGMNMERDTIYLDLRVMGGLQDRARRFAIKQENAGEPSAAQPGVHYVAFDDPGMTPLLQVPANANRYQMPVILLRDPGLREETVVLKLAIVENDEFKIGLEQQSSFQIKVSDQLMPTSAWRPGYAGGWAYVFGEYGPQKHWFVITYVGFTDLDGDVSTYPIDVRRFYNQQAREKLAEYNATHPVLTESNGQEVFFNAI